MVFGASKVSITTSKCENPSFHWKHFHLKAWLSLCLINGFVQKHYFAKLFTLRNIITIDGSDIGNRLKFAKTCLFFEEKILQE
jgi:hypothetical protein